MELIVHIIVGVAVFGLIYEHVKLRVAYKTVYDAYEQLELEAFYSEKEYQKLNEELINKNERLEDKLLKLEPATTKVIKATVVRKKAASKKIPNVE